MTKANHKEIMDKLKRKMDNIDEKYKRFEDEIKLLKAQKEKKHPQPATVENHALNGVR